MPLGDALVHHQCLTVKDLPKVEKVIKLLLLELDRVKMIQEVRRRNLLVNQVNKNVDQVQVRDVGQRKKVVNVAQQKNCNLWMHNLSVYLLKTLQFQRELFFWRGRALHRKSPRS